MSVLVGSGFLFFRSIISIYQLLVSIMMELLQIQSTNLSLDTSDILLKGNRNIF